MLDIIIASYGLFNQHSEFVPLNLHHRALNLTTMAFIKIIDFLDICHPTVMDKRGFLRFWLIQILKSKRPTDP